MSQTSNYHHGNLRQALLDAAINEIRQHGVEKLSLRALARSLGVSQTAPYRHFADKDSLLAELATEAFDALADAVRAKLDSTKSAFENTVAAGNAYLEFGLNNPEKYRLMFGTGIQNREDFPLLKIAGNGAFELLFSLIEAGQKTGVFVSGSSALLANACWSALHGFVLLSIDGMFARRELPASPEAMQQFQIEFTLRSLLTSKK